MTNLNQILLFARKLLKRPVNVSSNIQLRMLQQRFLTDLTYRLPNKAKNDLLIGFKEWKRIVFRSKNQTEQKEVDGCVLVSSAHQQTLALAYIEANTDKKKLSVLVRENLCVPHFNWQFHLFAFRIALQCLFDKRRVNLALLIREVVEWCAVSTFLKEKKTNAFFDFTPFEKDSNALAFWLMKTGVYVTKIPSPGPLAGHHTFMIADEVVLSSAYQLEELPEFKHWYVTKLLRWPPEHYMNYASQYISGQLPPKTTLGFYSHGEWVRKKAGHADFGYSIQENENFLLESLRKFLLSHPEFELTIFPHPKERTDPEFPSVYLNFFEGTRTTIATSDKKSSETFNEIGIGMMAYSTLIFERLSLGFKTIIATHAPALFPIPSSPLNALCVSNYSEFECALLVAFQETEQEFFLRTKIENYPLNKFLEQKEAEIQK